MNGVAGGRWDGKGGGEIRANQRKAGMDRWKDGQRVVGMMVSLLARTANTASTQDIDGD